MELISGLPEDIARDCLIRLAYHQFPMVASICKGWNKEIHSPEFHRRRRSTKHAQNILVTVQSKIDSEKSRTGLVSKCTANPVYRLSVLEPETGSWSELPLGPELACGLPMFCQIVGIGFDLVVMGGWDPDSWKACNSVFIYNFLSAKWRRGADMPGGPRTFFACASDQDHTVYVAGGHDEEKNALRSALAYDVARDVWVTLPDMSRERDECRAVFRCGALCVVGGYCTEMQGRFERSAEVFDVARGQWGPLEEDFLDAGVCPRTCVVDAEGRKYMCVGGDVVALQGDTWRKVARVPSDLRNVACLSVWEGSMLVIGSSGFGDPHMGFLLDQKSGAWIKLLSPEEYTGHVQSACLMQI